MMDNHQGLDGQIGQQLFVKAGELNMPVGFMCFKGLKTNLAAIQKLMYVTAPNR